MATVNDYNPDYSVNKSINDFLNDVWNSNRTNEFRDSCIKCVNKHISCVHYDI